MLGAFMNFLSQVNRYIAPVLYYYTWPALVPKGESQSGHLRRRAIGDSSLMKTGSQADELDECRYDEYLPTAMGGNTIVTEWKLALLSCITRGSGNKPSGA
jgi:hypothetical protein